MLLSLSGASGVGKSTALAELARAGLGPDVTCVEFDSIGVPADADTAWRHGATERWVRFAIEEQDAGRHVLLAGQVAPGEILAAPSADLLDGIAVHVLHCSPAMQELRLVGRGEPADSLVHHLRFGAWFQRHAMDPSFQPEVIRVDSAVPMAWERWEGVSGDSARWPVCVTDTDELTPAEVVQRVRAWALEQLEIHNLKYQI